MKFYVTEDKNGSYTVLLRHMHGVKFFDEISSQIIIVLNIEVNLVSIQIFCQVDDLLHATSMVAHFQTGLKPRIIVLVHFIQLGRQIIQYGQIFVFAQLVIEAIHIAIIVRYESFFIGIAEIVLLANANALEYFLHFLDGSEEIFSGYFNK